MNAPTLHQLQLIGGRSNPFQTLVVLFVTALFFMLFQVKFLNFNLNLLAKLSW